MAVVIIIAVVLVYGLFHGHHSRRAYRHYREQGHRGVSLYWRAGCRPYVTIPGPFGTRIGRRL